jgi:hypothetical protein
MADNRYMGYWLESGISFTSINLGPYSIASVSTVSLARVRGGISWTANNVNQFGAFPAFVTGLQYGSSGYTPWAINDPDGYNNWLWLGHCRSISHTPTISNTTEPSIIGEHDTLEGEWSGQFAWDADIDFYVTVAVNPANTDGVTGAFVIGSVEIMYA